MRNIFIVWMLTGLWHGASWNFAIWGLYFAVILVIEKVFLLKVLEKMPKILRALYSFALVLFGFNFFYFEDFGRNVDALKVMFGTAGASIGAADALRMVVSYLPFYSGVHNMLIACETLHSQQAGEAQDPGGRQGSCSSFVHCHSIYHVGSQYSEQQL